MHDDNLMIYRNRFAVQMRNDLYNVRNSMKSEADAKQVHFSFRFFLLPFCSCLLVPLHSSLKMG